MTLPNRVLWVVCLASMVALSVLVAIDRKRIAKNEAFVNCLRTGGELDTCRNVAAAIARINAGVDEQSDYDACVKNCDELVRAGKTHGNVRAVNTKDGLFEISDDCECAD